MALCTVHNVNYDLLAPDTNGQEKDNTEIT